MNRKYLSVHFVHNDHDSMMTFKPQVTSLDDSGFFLQQDENFEFSNPTDVLKDENHKKLALPAALSVEEEANFLGYDSINEYANEPELHILKVKNPFSEDPDESVMITSEGDLITSLAPAFMLDENSVLEDNFLNNQIYDYAYGATGDRIPDRDTDGNYREGDYLDASQLIYDVAMDEKTLNIAVIGRRIALENNIETDDWNIYLDSHKLAELTCSCDECLLENNELKFYDKKGQLQKITGSIRLANEKTIDFDDLELIRWHLI